MAIDWFGLKKRQKILKEALKREIERELQVESNALLQDWEASDQKEGRDPRVSYKTLEQLYKKESWVRACIDVTARTGTSNGFVLVAKEGVEESSITDREVEPIHNLLETPNPNDTFSEIITEVITDLHLYGDAYVEIVLDEKKQPKGIFNLYAPSIRALVDKHGTVLGYVQMVQSSRGGKGEAVVFRPEEIIHFRFPNPGNEVYGLSPLESLFLPIEVDLWAQEYNKKFFQNNATPRLHVDLGNCTLAQLKRTREYFRHMLKGASNAHKTLVTEGGTKIEAIGVQPKDMEFLNQRKFSRDEICAVMGVPPMKIGIFEDVNRASALESDKSFKKEKIIPLQRMIAKKINLSLISLFKSRVEFTFVELDLQDAKERAQIDAIDIKSGVITIEEARRRRGLPPLEMNENPSDNGSEEDNGNEDVVVDIEENKRVSANNGKLFWKRIIR